MNLLSVKEVAEYLGTRTHSVLTLIHSGELPVQDISLTDGGKPRWRIKPEDLEAFLERRTLRIEPKRRRPRRPTTKKKYF